MLPPGLDGTEEEAEFLRFVVDSFPSSSSSLSSSLRRFSESRSGGGVWRIGDGESLGVGLPAVEGEVDEVGVGWGVEDVELGGRVSIASGSSSSSG